jgi:O-antigen/teichoic acid export membrane protein
MQLSKSALNSVFLISEKVLIIGFAFVVSILLARLGGPELFGQYAYITSFASIFAPLCMMGLNNIITKYVVRYPHNSHHYIKSALLIRLVGAIASVIIGSAVVLTFNHDQQSTPFILLLLVFQSVNAFLIYEYFFLAKNQVLVTLKIRVAVSLIANIAKVSIIVINPNLFMLIVVQCVEYVFIAGLYHLQYRINAHSLSIIRPVKRHTLEVLAHKGKWLLLSGIAAVIYMKIDQVMLANLVSTESVAYYAAAAKLSEFWYAFPILVANAYNASIIERRKAGAKKMNELLTLMLSAFIAASLLISICLYFLSADIIRLIYGEAYAASSAILSVHIFASIFIFQRAILSKWLIITNQLKFSLITHGIGAVINVLLNIILIPKYQGIGAAWATLISYAFASYFALFFSAKTRPFAFLMTKAMLQWPKNLIAVTLPKKQNA